MVKVTNELIERGFVNAEAYSDFGLKRVEEINARLRDWAQRKSFGEDVVPSFYSSMAVKGDIGKGKNSINWELEFEESIRDKTFIEQDLCDGLLHARDRLSPVVSHGSAPNIFNTANYIHMTVGNRDGGWVEKGVFPAATTWVRQDVDLNKKSREFETTLEAVYCDVRRDSIAGFKAVEEWAKFRAMASGCSDFVMRSLKSEWAGVKTNRDQNCMRDRSKESMRFMLSLLPDVRARSGTTALREYYRPGLLEGAVALELEKGTTGNRRGFDKSRIMYSLRGEPIEVMSTPGKGNYDARLNFGVETHSCGDSDNDVLIKGFVQENLGKYFDIDVVSPSEFNVSFYVPNANKVCCDIVNGGTETSLHKESRNLIDAVKGVYSSIKSWSEDQMPALEKGYEAMVGSMKDSHFEKMGKGLDSRLGK